MAPPAWNAGLQTGTRGAPHLARHNLTRKGVLRLGAELPGGGDATAWNAGFSRHSSAQRCGRFIATDS